MVVAPVLFTAGMAGAQGITAETPSVTEGDTAAVNAAFHYHFPAAASDRSFEFAVIPGNLQPGTDFTAFRETRTAVAGTPFEGTVTVPVLPDLTPEENGSLSLVVRGPETADWAAAMTAPVVWSTLGSGTYRVIHVADDLVVSAAYGPNQTSSLLRIHERTAAGELALRQEISLPEYRALSAQANDRVIIAPGQTGMKTWRRIGNSFTWQAVGEELKDTTVGTLFSDRLVTREGENGMNAVYRMDPDAPGGWRRTGETGLGEVIAVGGDYLVLRTSNALSIHERAAGSEDQWQAVYDALPELTVAVVGAGPGMVAAFGAEGLQIHERVAGQWSRTGTVPVSVSTAGEMSVAVAGDWMAVGRSRPSGNPPGEEGTVQLFLRDRENRSVWNAAGTLTGPGAEYGRQLRWNGPELISAPSISSPATSAVVRRLPGATAAVLDDDRCKPLWLAAPLREPMAGTGIQTVMAELPLAAASDITFDLDVMDGTARNGADFSATSGRITILAGSARAALPITVMADAELEPTENLTLRLLPAGQPPVTARIEIRDGKSPAVVTATAATPLIEGYGSGTIALRQSAATGSVLPAAPGSLGIFTGGFENPPDGSRLTTLDVDLPSQDLTRELTAGAPETSFTVTATQDSDVEWHDSFSFAHPDERVRTVIAGLGTPREAGTLGISFEGDVPMVPAAQGEFPNVHGWAMGGEWLFVEWAGNPQGAQPAQGVVAVHRLSAGRTSVPAAIQYIPWESVPNSAAISSDGRTLIMSFLKNIENAGPTAVLRMYEPTGAAETPWRLTSEWRQFATSSNSEVRMLGPDRILWGRQLLERTGGYWPWRLAGYFTFGEILDADGDWLLMRGDTPSGSVNLHRRQAAYQPGWTLVRGFTKSHDQQVDSFYKAWVRGRNLVLFDGQGRVEIHRESAEGDWEFEQVIPKGENFPEMLMVGESTLVLAQGIHSRIGSGAAPWVLTGDGPGFMNFQENLGLTERTISAVNASVAGAVPRLRVMGAGVPLTVYDDDSLVFTLSAPQGIENYFSETVAQVALLATRPAPFPMTVRVRSRNNGGALAGLDYVPVDFEVAAPPPGQARPYYTTFPVRILSDRVSEGFERLRLIMDPPLIGKVSIPVEMIIQDSYNTVIQPMLSVATVIEPVEGSVVQAVEFAVEVAFDQDIEFTVSADAGGTAAAGTDFTLPAGKLTLKAGEARLRVPLSLLSDALDEPAEEFALRVTADPVRQGFTSAAKVIIVDATVSGLSGDVYPNAAQGTPLTADGLNGNPSGVRGNDPAPPAGDYKIAGQPSWGAVDMKPDGTFTATAGPNVTGPVSFAAQVVTIPFKQFLDSTAVWKYLHPLNGISPAVANPDFPSTWTTAAFDDSAWAGAAGTLTYGGFAIPVTPNTVILQTPPVGRRYTDYFRTVFQSDGAVTLPLTLQLHCDDGAVIYINGIERGRAVTNTSTTFPTAPDTYTMVTGGTQNDDQEAALKTVSLGEISLKAGANLLAISLHNLSNTSSDLGLRLVSLETGVVSDPVPVTIHFSDAHAPPAGAADSYICPQNVEFLSSDRFGAGLLDNDGLISPSGQPYDPILEITASAVSAGTLRLVRSTGHFAYTPPPDFSGTATFTYQIRDKDGLSAPVPVTLNVQPVQPFDLWKAEALTAGAGSMADSDGDGVPNFMEYALGTDPADGSTANGYGFVTKPDGTLSVMVRRAADLAWILESATSPDSAEWTMVIEGRGLNYQSPVPAGVTITNVTDASQVLNITSEPGASPRWFYRLRTFRIPPQ